MRAFPDGCFVPLPASSSVGSLASSTSLVLMGTLEPRRRIAIPPSMTKPFSASLIKSRLDGEERCRNEPAGPLDIELPKRRARGQTHRNRKVLLRAGCDLATDAALVEDPIVELAAVRRKQNPFRWRQPGEPEANIKVSHQNIYFVDCFNAPQLIHALMGVEEVEQLDRKLKDLTDRFQFVKTNQPWGRRTGPQ